MQIVIGFFQLLRATEEVWAVHHQPARVLLSPLQSIIAQEGFEGSSC